MVATVMVLTACVTPPAATVSVADDGQGLLPPALSAAAAYEKRLKESALLQQQTHRLAESAISWELLTVLQPESAEYRERLRDVRRLAEVALVEKLARADAALKKADFDAATTHYLGALALDPASSRASEGLRQAERERNRRSVLGKSSRLLLTKRSTADSQAVAASVNAPRDSNELEVATMLGKQGEYDDAIATLEARLAVDKSDSSARLLLADLYAQKAEKRLARDRVGAIAAFEKSVRLDPSNAAVALRLKRVKAGAGGQARLAVAGRAASSVVAAAPAVVVTAAVDRVVSGTRPAASGASAVAPQASGAASKLPRAASATAPARAASSSDAGGMVRAAPASTSH